MGSEKVGATILVGGLFGDEGKGKVIAHLALADDVSIVARGGVGPNAGHTVELGGKSEGVRMVPSGFVHPKARLLIGAGVLVNPDVLLEEVDRLGVKGRIGVDRRCTLIEPQHIKEDRKDSHLHEFIGSTGSGCGPANKDRVMRVARQASEEPRIAEHLTDVPRELDEAMNAGKRVLVEGTQGFGISLLYGSYPYVTSKDTSASQMAADVGIGPTKVDDVIVVFKAYPTRVGEGPFPGEISEDEAKKLGIAEFGTVTGRPRRIGLWNGEMARYSAMINGATQCAITGLDRLDPSCRGASSVSELSREVLDFVSAAEKDVGVPFTLLSTGPGTKEIVDIRAELGFDVG